MKKYNLDKVVKGVKEFIKVRGYEGIEIKLEDNKLTLDWFADHFDNDGNTRFSYEFRAYTDSDRDYINIFFDFDNYDESEELYKLLNEFNSIFPMNVKAYYVDNRWRFSWAEMYENYHNISDLFATVFANFNDYTDDAEDNEYKDIFNALLALRKKEE